MSAAMFSLTTLVHLVHLLGLTVLGVAILISLIRLCLGPTLFDRVLSMNVVGTLVILLIALIGFISGRPEFLDIALLYALINFISTIAILKILRYRTLGQISLSQEGGPDGVD
jgi:multicomponent Na+:H+ antiporter subunit F